MLPWVRTANISLLIFAMYATVAGRAVAASETAQDPLPADAPHTESKGDLPSASYHPLAGVELSVGYGGAFGGGMLQHKTKPGRAWTLGVGKEFAVCAATKVRLALSGGATRLGPRIDGLSGPLTVRSALLRADYVLNLSHHIRPYAGVGTGLYLWKIDETQTASGLKNSGDKRDGGVLLAAGVDLPVQPYLTVAPEVIWNRIYGTFNQQLWSVELMLRWSV